ncbi:MAG TPA: CoA ester lyase [Alphaproteobacteria bacterium]
MTGEQTAAGPKRAVSLRRSYLFLPGADAEALRNGPASGADVLIQELEDFTPPQRLPEARALAPSVLAAWRAAGAVAAVRINPFGRGGEADLAAVMRGRPDVVALPKVAEPAQIAALDRAIAEQEERLGIAPGTTEILPNIELARGLIQTGAIARASPRVKACLVASEDMAADLGAERGRDGMELAYVRARFLVECVAAGVVAVDCPYTFADAEGVEAETRQARRLGYRSKSCVAPAHAGIINRVLTPAPDEVAQARRIIDAFEDARARGLDRVEVDGSLVEVPTYLNAKRLVARAEALAAADGTRPT